MPVGRTCTWLLLGVFLGGGSWVGAAAAATTATKSTSARNSTKTSKRRRTPRPPKVSAARRSASLEAVQAHLIRAATVGIINPTALVPFFERLFFSTGDTNRPLRVLQFGDSHTASDAWPGAIRKRFQFRFGSGGPGFVHAGRPFRGYRRLDAPGSMSRGWMPAGLLNREGDGVYGISGVSLTSQRAGEQISLKGEGSRLEVFYYRQPPGGSFELYVNGMNLATVDTAGEAGPGYFRAEIGEGPHAIELKTLSASPVRLFGWVLENPRGITWETLGINGAQADLVLGWQNELLRSQIERRDPALIVLAYGTNEARKKGWTYESYKAAFAEVLRRFRASAPTASILVLGPPDQSIRVSRRWRIVEGVDIILEAQRAAALESGCAFWDIRASMGGRGVMRQWVEAGLAQGDFVHLTSAGYQALGDSLYDTMMGQYGDFAAVRRDWLGATSDGPSSKD